METFVGTAAWNLPKEFRHLFDERGSHLESYASRLNGVEINSSFYRDHKAATYARWAETVPEDFRFSVKLSKVFTHEQRLKRGEKDLASNIEAIAELGEKWGALLVQLPPSLEFVKRDAISFFDDLRELVDVPIAFEPRHSSWIEDEALEVLHAARISRVYADPDWKKLNPPLDAEQEIAYLRLHGSPQIYKSEYSWKSLREYADSIAEVSSERPVWCVFDNTTFGHATGNAVTLANFQHELAHA